MTKRSLLSATQLHAIHKEEGCCIFDCRFSLTDPGAGFEAYLESHIPGAVYAHLDNDLAGPVTDVSGRHPLPDAGKFAAFLGRSGWRPEKLLVAYDDVGGAIAARLWWLMKYFGQVRVALLDGGIPAWWAAGFAADQGAVRIQKVPPENLDGHHDLVVGSAQIVGGLSRNEVTLVDARAAARFEGDTEPIDSVAGHIPGAINYPYNLNLTSDGHFKTVAEIRTGLAPLTSGQEERGLVHMCGSGVTACHNLFAAEMAGMESSRLYVGSWSEWIRDPTRPISCGADDLAGSENK